MSSSSIIATKKRYEAMKKIGRDLSPACYASAWSLVAAEAKKGFISGLLQSGFHLKPSVEEVLGIYTELSTEFTEVMSALKNHGSANRTNDGKFKKNYAKSESNLCFVNFLRDFMEIPDLAMIRMRRVLAECNCCRRHMMRRPCCQEKKRELKCGGQEVYPEIQFDTDCKCACRSFARHLEEALTEKMPLEVKGQLWERST